MRRLLLLLALAAATAVVAWTGLALPPPSWILRYGPDWRVRATGRTVEIEGVEFVEIGPGGWRRPREPTESDVARRVGAELGVVRPTHFLLWYPDPPVDRWFELPEAFFVAREPVSFEAWSRFDPSAPNLADAGGRTSPQAMTWRDVGRYCRWLSRKSGGTIRPPTWEQWSLIPRLGPLFFGAESEWNRDRQRYGWLDTDAGFMVLRAPAEFNGQEHEDTAALRPVFVPGDGSR